MNIHEQHTTSTPYSKTTDVRAPIPRRKRVVFSGDQLALERLWFERADRKARMDAARAARKAKTKAKEVE